MNKQLLALAILFGFIILDIYLIYDYEGNNKLKLVALIISLVLFVFLVASYFWKIRRSTKI